MPELLEEFQLMGYAISLMPKKGKVAKKDPICENVYRLFKNGEDNFRYPYLHDYRCLFPECKIDAHQWFFQLEDSKYKILRIINDNAQKF